jgi:hypothetical protein
MPPLTDPERLRCYQNALKNWRWTDVVVFKPRAWEWLRANLLRAYSQKAIVQLLHKHVEAGGVIHEVMETRPEWKEYEFHYDLRVQIDGRLFYFETILDYKDPNDPDDPTICVVSIHDAKP